MSADYNEGDETDETEKFKLEVTYSVVLLEPVTGENGEISGGWREWNRDHWTAGDGDATEASGSSMKSKGREVEEATDLILYLKNVGEVLTRWNGAIRAINSILP